MANSEEEQEVIEEIIQGDTDRFAWVVARYEGLIAKIVLSHVPPAHLDEVAQRVCIAVYESLPKYRAEAPFKNWLSKIAVHTCHTFWRERYRQRELSVSVLSDQDYDWAASIVNKGADEEFRRSEDARHARDVLFWALEQLAEDDRAVVTLVHLQEYSTREAAELLGWSESNVKVRTHRARNALRQILEKLAAE